MSGFIITIIATVGVAWLLFHLDKSDNSAYIPNEYSVKTGNRYYRYNNGIYIRRKGK